MANLNSAVFEHFGHLVEKSSYQDITQAFNTTYGVRYFTKKQKIVQSSNQTWLSYTTSGIYR